MRHTLAINRPLLIETRDEGPSTLSGYAAVYYRADDPGTEYELFPGMVERIDRGAFDGFEEFDVRALVNHDPNQILGRTSSRTLRLSTDDIGLRFEVDLPDTTTGRDAAESIARGDLDGSSFSFRLGDEQRSVENGVQIRTITRFDQLFDVGPVTFPAYESTSVSARAIGDVSEEKKQFEELRRSRRVKAKLALLRTR